MSRLGKRIGLAALAGLIAWGAGAPGAYAQRVQSAGTLVGPGTSAGFFPFFRVVPSLSTLQQAANLAALGRAYSQVPPYSPLVNGGRGFNPFPSSPIIPNGTSTVILPSSLGGYNPYLAPGYNPYLSANPYLTGNPYAGDLSSLTSTGTLPTNSGYGTGSLNNAINPYGYGYTSYPDPYGGYLKGGADVINAQGHFLVSAGQADQLHEDVRRQRIENRRRILDEYLYERDKIPTTQDERERTQKLNLRRFLNDAPANEVYSSVALNALLDDLVSLQNKGVTGPAISLDDKTLAGINVSAGSGGNAGLLKNDGQLDWPLALRADAYKPEVEVIRANLPDAIRDAVNGRLDPSTVKALTAAVDRLSRHLAAEVRDLPPGQYLEAKRFLANLADAVAVLRQPGAGKYFTGEWAAKGKTVPDLVRYMKEKGLKFAPAVDGLEANYMALYQALVACDVAAKGQQTQQVAEERK